MRTIGFFALRPGRYRHSDYLAGRDSNQPFFKRKFPIGLTSKFGNLVWPNARAALVLSVSPMFYTGFESLVVWTHCSLVFV
jgi:hypothetical protein